ncbi:MAG: hypothetical protein GY926_03960, partial [bacterium]|nr:hypothetical protein [bacterium]
MEVQPGSSLNTLRNSVDSRLSEIEYGAAEYLGVFARLYDGPSDDGYHPAEDSHVLAFVDPGDEDTVT